MWLVYLLIAIVLWQGASGSNPHVFTVGNVTVQYLGQSGKMQIWPTSQNNSDNSYIRITMNKMEEVGTDTKNRINEFASSDFNWIGPSNVTFGNASAVETKFASTLTLHPSWDEVYFNMSTWIFEDEASINYTGKLMSVYPGEMKFTISIQNWPFDNAENNLTFGITMTMHSGENDTNDLQMTTDANGDQILSMNGKQIRAPKRLLCNGEEKEAGVNYTRDGNTLELNFLFGYCNGKIIYDPIVALTEYNMDNGSNSHWGTILAVVLSIICAGLVAVFCIRARSKKSGFQRL